jgi:hypothetical protein
VSDPIGVTVAWIFRVLVALVVFVFVLWLVAHCGPRPAGNEIRALAAWV